ncbi:MAG: sugar phosphate isomerase/epimerase [Actinobacteria bacterium]|jgi:sugar phosphate isomerase/epimerase|nr:sugar phosphate isomerase/epimerase [Actinomycetota bacterium]
MKIGCNTVAFRKYPLEVALEKVAAAGYEYVEVEANLSWCSHADPWKDDPSTFAQTVSNYGFLGVSALGSHRELISDERSVPDLSRALEWCGEAGIPIVITGEGRLPEGMSVEYAMGVLEERLPVLAEVATRSGVKIALEDHGSISLGSLDGLPQILDIVDDESVVVNFDTANIRRGDYVGTTHEGYGWKLDNAKGYDEVELLRRVVNRVGHLHVKDVVGRDAVALGKGEIDLFGCLNVLKDARFNGVLSYETEGNEDIEDAIEMITTSRVFLQDALRNP